MPDRIAANRRIAEQAARQHATTINVLDRDRRAAWASELARASGVKPELVRFGCSAT